MKKLIQTIMGFFGYVPRGTVEHTLVMLQAPVKWTTEDANAWHAFWWTPVWEKINSLSHDAMVQGMLPHSAPYRDDPRLQQAFILGRRVQMEYLSSLAVPKKPNDPENPELTEIPFDDDETENRVAQGET